MRFTAARERAAAATFESKVRWVCDAIWFIHIAAKEPIVEEVAAELISKPDGKALRSVLQGGKMVSRGGSF